MPKLLALDTSTDACSVALYLNGEVREDFRVIPRQHTKQLLPMIQTMLEEAGIKVTDLDAIAFGRGPGSFAGIRIATGVAQGLAFAAEIPLLPISTLESIALSKLQTGETHVVAALDARMDEIYWAAYRSEAGLPIAVTPERVDAPANVALPDGTLWCGAGSGWCYLADMPESVQASVTVSSELCYPTASTMLTLALRDFAEGKAVSPEQALPVYLRDDVAWKKKDQQ